jgi:PEP-CTERM motif
MFIIRTFFWSAGAGPGFARAPSAFLLQILFEATEMTRKSAILATLVGGAMLSSLGSANAEIRYDFTAYSAFDFGYGTLTEGSFTYFSPNFVVPNFTVPVADLASCSAAFSSSGPVACGDQSFLNNISYETILFGISVTNLYYYFDPTAFSTPGTYQTVLFGDAQAAQLVVSIVSVPEPSTWAMMLIGFAGLGFVGYRARRTAWIVAAS